MRGSCNGQMSERRRFGNPSMKLGLHEPQFKPRLIGHHIHAPRWLPCQVDLDMFDAGQRLNRFGDPAGHFACHGATRCGQCHQHAHHVFFGDVDSVDKAQIIDVHRNFRVVHGAARLDHLVIERVICRRGGDQRCPFNGVCGVSHVACPSFILSDYIGNGAGRVKCSCDASFDQWVFQARLRKPRARPDCVAFLAESSA